MLNPLGRFEWERVVRRVAMHPTTKLVAFTLASYGNRVGNNAHPGNKRLALDCGVHERTVERHLTWLREHGLIERVFRGSTAGRSRQADTYRLVIADNLPDLVTFTSPDTRDGSSTPESPDTDDGSSEETPDMDVASYPPEHPTSSEEHPTPVSRTPDICDRTPDTRVAPSSTYIKHDQEEHHHAAGLTAARTCGNGDSSHSVVGSAPSKTEIEMAALRTLGSSRCSALLDAASADVEGDDFDWAAIVHAAYKQAMAGAA